MNEPTELQQFYIPEEQSVYLLSQSQARQLREWIERCRHQLAQVGYREVELIGKGALDALQGMADALPALGIVAAVLGIIKTMGAINQPPEYLGKLIGSALVGTFLGVFLAYGLVGPFAARMGEVIDEEGKFYQIIKDVLVAHLHGNAAQISVEIGRGNIPTPAQPSFAQLEEALNSAPEAA